MLRSLAGGTLFGESWGGEPWRVVALHGWRRTHADFAGVLGPGSPGGPLAAVAPDLPGFGATPPPTATWGSDEYARAVAPLVDVEAGGGGAVVLGHSLGGRVAVALAASCPQLVAGLVLSGAPLLPRPGGSKRPPLRYRTVRSLRRLGLVGGDRLERARRRYGSEDYRLAEGVMRDIVVRLVGENYEEALARVRCPVELVWGDDDTAAPLEMARDLARRIPRAELTVCPGAGHLTPLTVPGELRAAVERCLTRAAERR